MRRISPVATLLLNAGLLTVGLSASAQAQSEALETYRGATVGVGRIIKDGSKLRFSPIGSSVLVTKDGRKACLVTAKHVFFKPDEGFAPDYLQIRVPKDAAGPDDEGVKLQLIENGINRWHSLDDGSDLAIIDAPDLSQYFRINAIHVSRFSSDDDIYQGGSVIVYGYPALLSDYFSKTPIARSGMIAWVDPDGAATKPFLVDANLFPGNSGGPVFRVHNGLQKNGGIALGGGYTFAGIVSAGPRQFAPVRAAGNPIIVPSPDGSAPNPALAEVVAVGGIGAIEPVSKVRRLIDEHCK